MTYTTQGTYTVNWTYDDGNGNVVIQPQTVIVDDVTPPVVTDCQVDIEVNNDPGICGAVVTYEVPVFADNCDGTGLSGTLFEGLASGSTFPVGTTTVTYAYTDAVGNGPVVCTFTVTVNDNEPPTITAPADVTVNTDPGACETDALNVTLGSTITADNCGVLSVVNDAPAVFHSGNTTVTWTVTDIHGLSAQATQVVTVVDNEAPTVAACQSDITVNNDAGICGAAVTYTGPTFDDNCDGTGLTGILTEGLASGATFPVGTTNVTYTYTDAAGNGPATCSFTVTVIDNEDPTVSTCPTNIIVNNDVGLLGAVITYAQPTFEDNCDGTGLTGVMTAGFASGEVFPLGTTTVTYQYTDAASNTPAICTFTVTVNLINRAPTVANPIADFTVDEGFGTLDLPITDVFTDTDTWDSFTYAAATNNPSVLTVQVINNTTLRITEIGIGLANITLTATDNGAPPLSVDDVFAVDVNGTPFVATPLNDISADAGFSNILIDLNAYFDDRDGDPLSYEAISANPAIVNASINGSILTLTYVNYGTTDITITASDGSTLSATDAFTINVNGPPQLVTPLPDVALDEGFGLYQVDIAGTFSDPDGDALTYTAFTGNAAVAIASMNGSLLSITEVAPGITNITVRASDGSTLRANDVFALDINGGPVVTAEIPDYNRNAGFGNIYIDLNNYFEDPESDPLTYTASSSNTGVVTTSVNGSILRIIEVSSGSAQVTVTASDGPNLEVQDIFTVDVNGAPVVAAPLADVSLDEGFGTETVDLTGVFSDPEGDALSYTVSSNNPGVVQVSVAGTTITITEVAIGTANVTVTATDGALSVQDVFTVDVNGGPVVASGISNRDYREGFGTAAFSLTGAFSDPEGDPLSYTAVSADESVVTVDVTGDILTITEAGPGTTTVTVTASDNSSLTGATTFQVNVNAAPQVAAGISDVALNEGFGTYAVNLTGAFSDPESDPLTYTAVSANSAIVTVSVSGNTLTITEVNHGSTTVTVTASDGSTITPSTAFTVDVNGAPDVTGPLAAITLENGFGSTTVDISGVFTDPEGDAMTYSIANSNPSAVTAVLNGTLVTITEETYGTATISVIANDGQLSATDQFDVTVNVVLPPDWTYVPANYDYDGQLTAQVYIDRDTVRSGFLGAFVNGECRGIVDPIYFTVEETYVFNMIVYSDVSTGTYLKFKYYDYENDLEYELYDSVAFNADMILGDAFSPVRLHYYPGFEKSLVTGWNWFSLNLDALDRSVGSVMPECVVEGDYIKNQTVSATYYDGFGWFGQLEEIDPTMLYKTRINTPCTISTLGNSVDIQTTPISLVRGWNWIGFLPNESLPIDEALSSYAVTDLDYIKSQVASATYYDGFGWYGSMKTMHPGEGFMIKVAAPSTLVYPEPSAKKAIWVEGNDPLPAGIDPSQYEFSGTVTARVFLNGEAIGSEDDLLMAYVGDECRGVMHGMYFDPASAYAYQMLVYSNLAEGEQVTFRYYQAATGRTYECAETLEFRSDMIVADAHQAFALNLDNAVGIDGSPMEQGIRMNAYPNPFRNNLRIDITVQESTHMQLAVYDLMGKMMFVLGEQDLAPGTFSMEWNAGGLPSGTYVLKAVMDREQIVKRVTLID
ncbi:MAG: HYR domain-containing protein [Bacteroidales bacterium]|nr:HYR domain-containing protein [Bacteroidales bacterium]